jgi:hypothetical protein
MKNSSAIFAVAFIALVSFGSGCEAKERNNVAEPSPAAPITPETHPSPSAPGWLAPGATHRVADITGAPNAAIGKTVTVVAEVDEVYGPRAFTLEGDGDLSKDARKDLLTLVPKVGGFPKVDDQWKDSEARVTGVVQRMVAKDVEREIGWELPAKLKSRFKGSPVLIARSVERLAE